MILAQDVTKGKTTAERTDDDASPAGVAGTRTAATPLTHDELTHFVGFDWASDHHHVALSILSVG
jgi:hypothetical protein